MNAIKDIDSVLFIKFLIMYFIQDFSIFTQLQHLCYLAHLHAFIIVFGLEKKNKNQDLSHDI